MAGKIVVSEILSDATSSNTVKIGTGMTLDLNAQGTVVLPAASLVGSLPAGIGGKVLQVVQTSFQGSSNISTTSTTFQAIGTSLSMTTLGAGSTILFACSGNTPHTNHATSNNGVGICLYHRIASGSWVHIDGSGSSNNHTAVWQNDLGSGWIDFPGHFEVFYTPTYTSGQTIDFQPYFRVTDANGSGDGYFHHNGGSGANNVIRLMATEIAG